MIPSSQVLGAIGLIALVIVGVIIFTPLRRRRFAANGIVPAALVIYVWMVAARANYEFATSHWAFFLLQAAAGFMVVSLSYKAGMRHARAAAQKKT